MCIFSFYQFHELRPDISAGKNLESSPSTTTTWANGEGSLMLSKLLQLLNSISAIYAMCKSHMPVRDHYVNFSTVGLRHDNWQKGFIIYQT